MSVRAFNKVTKNWTSTEDGSELTPPQDWVVNPVFSPDENLAMSMGPEFWSYSGNTITTATPEAYAAIMKERAQRACWLAIQQERDRRKWGGVKVGTKWFHSDDTSRIQQLGLVMIGANLPANLMWKTMDTTFVVMTPTLAMQIFGATAAQDVTLFTVAEQHRAQMMAAENPTDYNFMNGWPLTFGE